MFTKNFFANNRIKLARCLPNSLVCIPAHSALQESADLAYPFRQDSSFWYFCGINEPDLLLVIDTATDESTIYLPEQNDYQKEWDGAQDTKRMSAISGITTFKTRHTFEETLNKAIKSKRQLCYVAPLPERVEPYGFYANPARRLLETVLKKSVDDIKDIRKDVARLRQIKQEPEIDAIQRAIDITAQALAYTKKNLGAFQSEKEVENTLSAQFFIYNSEGHAYEPIVACGKNASIIHYNDNDSPLEQNKLLLLDVGARVDGYAADISRTWAVSTPTHRHRELLSAVLLLQQEAFSMLKPGILLREYQKVLEQRANELFKPLGIVFEKYPHGFSHFLGLDVHDAGIYDEPLQENTVLTVEPGVYVPEEGIGIRVEDNVIITKNGIKNLSANIPKVL